MATLTDQGVTGRRLAQRRVTATLTDMLTLIWVLITSRSPARVGLVTFGQALPLVLAALLAGPLVDRLGPRR